MSDNLGDVCRVLGTISSGIMQGIQDIFVSGTQFIGPVIKSLLDVTASIIPGGGGNSTNGSKKDLKKGRELSFRGTGNGNGKPPGLQFNRNLIRLAGISGAAAVGLGAYGAHVIMVNDKIPEDQKHSFRTANMYHFIGTFGLVAASLSSYPRVSGLLMAVGTTVFCGACYIHGFTGDRSVKKFAPYGGSTLILAWLSLALP